MSDFGGTADRHILSMYTVDPVACGVLRGRCSEGERYTPPQTDTVVRFAPEYIALFCIDDT